MTQRNTSAKKPTYSIATGNITTETAHMWDRAGGITTGTLATHVTDQLGDSTDRTPVRRRETAEYPVHPVPERITVNNEAEPAQ